MLSYRTHVYCSRCMKYYRRKDVSKKCPDCGGLLRLYPRDRRLRERYREGKD